MATTKTPTPVARFLTPAESFDRWREYTEHNLHDAHPLVWLTERWRFEEPLYREILRLVPPRGRILEVGTGGGPNLIWLASRGYETTGVDYVPEVIEIARCVAEAAQLGITYEVADAFDLSSYRGFDLVFSVGMVEHWDYPDAVRAIREQALCASTVIVNVPTIHTRRVCTPTDERFWSRRELTNMLKDGGLSHVRVFGYGDVAGWRGRAARALLPEIPYHRLLQRHFGWRSSSMAAIGRSSSSRV